MRTYIDMKSNEFYKLKKLSCTIKDCNHQNNIILGKDTINTVLMINFPICIDHWSFLYE